MPEMPLDTDKIKALINQSELLSDGEKNAYRRLLHLTEEKYGILERTGASQETIEDLRQRGAAALVDEEGKIKDPPTLGFTPQTIDGLLRMEEHRAARAQWAASNKPNDRPRPYRGRTRRAGGDVEGNPEPERPLANALAEALAKRNKGSGGEGPSL